MRSASANQRQAAVGGPRGWEPHWDGKRTGFAGVTGVLGYLEGQGLSSWHLGALPYRLLWFVHYLGMRSLASLAV